MPEVAFALNVSCQDAVTDVLGDDIVKAISSFVQFEAASVVGSMATCVDNGSGGHGLEVVLVVDTEATAALLKEAAEDNDVEVLINGQSVQAMPIASVAPAATTTLSPAPSHRSRKSTMHIIIIACVFAAFVAVFGILALYLRAIKKQPSSAASSSQLTHAAMENHTYEETPGQLQFGSTNGGGGVSGYEDVGPSAQQPYGMQAQDMNGGYEDLPAMDDGHAAIQNGAYMEQSGASSEGNSSDSDFEI